jgi:hypothetical protein
VDLDIISVLIDDGICLCDPTGSRRRQEYCSLAISSGSLILPKGIVKPQFLIALKYSFPGLPFMFRSALPCLEPTWAYRIYRRRMPRPTAIFLRERLPLCRAVSTESLSLVCQAHQTRCSQFFPISLTIRSMTAFIQIMFHKAIRSMSRR